MKTVIVKCPKCNRRMKCVNKRMDIWTCKNGCYTEQDSDRLFRDMVFGV